VRPSGSNTTITEAGKLGCQRFGNDAGCSGSLQIPVRLAPPIFIDDIGQRNAADWPKPSHGVPDGQQGIGVDARRQPECGLRCFLELQVQRRQCRAEAERFATSSMF
jgi:hypothetical protein